MSDTRNTPLQENEYVRELFAIMKANRVNTEDLRGLVDYVGAMERQLDTAVGELQSMRQELNNMREEQNHPVRTTLQNTVHALEKNINDARTKLDAIRETIIDGCKNAVSAFKENGISALSNIAGFFKIKESLQNLCGSLNNGIEADKRAIAKIESVSTEYHEAGKHIKNIARTVVGKETVQDARGIGKLAKALEAPFRSELSCLTGMKRNAQAAIGKLEQLEKAGMKYRQAEKKPSILGSLQTLKKQTEQAKRAAPAADRKKDMESSL